MGKIKANQILKRGAQLKAHTIRFEDPELSKMFADTILAQKKLREQQKKIVTNLRINL